MCRQKDLCSSRDCPEKGPNIYGKKIKKITYSNIRTPGEICIKIITFNPSLTSNTKLNSKIIKGFSTHN